MDDAPKAVVCAESNKSSHSKLRECEFSRATSVPRRPECWSAKAQNGHMENRAPQLAIP
jgi:hypothetical protein